jgi:hypothetical protein
MRPFVIYLLLSSLSAGCTGGALALPPPAAATPDAGAPSPAADGAAPADLAGADQTLAADLTASADAPATEAGPTPDEACGRYAESECAFEARCDPFFVASSWGDLEACKRLSKRRCLIELVAPGTNWTAVEQDGCAQALSNIDCGASYPRACFPSAGNLTDGSPCAFGLQCQAQYCKRVSGSACGTCVPPQPLGGPCAHFYDCQPSLWCVAKVCVASKKMNEPCTLADYCELPNQCIGATPSSAGVCQKQRQMGEPCNPHAFECAYPLGCKPLTATSGTCQPTPLAGDGQACGDLGSTIYDYVSCGGGETCKGSPRTCVAVSPDGAPCASILDCLPTSFCVDGVCQPEDSARCR